MFQNRAARIAQWFILSILVFPVLLWADEPFDYFQNSWNVIGLKDYINGTRVTPNNELLLRNKTKLWEERSLQFLHSFLKQLPDFCGYLGASGFKFCFLKFYINSINEKLDLLSRKPHAC